MLNIYKMKDMQLAIAKETARMLSMDAMGTWYVLDLLSVVAICNDEMLAKLPNVQSTDVRCMFVGGIELMGE